MHFRLLSNGKEPTAEGDIEGGTMSWVHVSIGSETISSTPEHPYFILNASSDIPMIRFEGRETNSTGCWVAAKDLVIGMKVLLSNGKYDTISMVEVEHLEQPETTYNFEVEISPSLLSCGELRKITAKKENTFNVEGKGLIDAAEVKVGDKIILESGEIAIVKSAEEKIAGGPQTTYNLEVEDFHTYYVGEQGILVHNTCPTIDGKDVYRGGDFEASSVKGHYKLDANGNVLPTRGPSVNINPADIPSRFAGNISKISSMPDELMFVGGPSHFEVVPRVLMPESRYLGLLKQIGLNPTGL